MKFSTKQEILQLENIGSGLFIFGTHADVTSYQNHLLSELYQEAQSDNEMFQTARGHLTSSSPLISLAVWVVSDEQDLTDIRKTVKTVAQWAAKQKQVSVDIAKLPESKVNHIVQLLMVEIANATYSFDNYKQTTTQQSLQEVVFHAGNHDIAHAVTFSEALIYGMTLCKDLGNTPGNVCTPKYLADTAKEQATELGADVSILDSEAIRQLGMNSFWSVAKGSTEGAYFIELRYHGAKNDAQPIVLVGKGITFDSGGISLKPGEGMDEMKYDMCGAATVLGTFCAAVKLKLPLNLVALIPTCENMPSGGANKPGDIVKTLNGLTVEVLNTDAEGRLILCDALTYAERFNPKAVIDVATLTGACIIALGHVASGVLGNNQDLVDCLIEAAKTSDDKIWQLPLFPEYREALKSNFADLQNIGGRPAGTITAATFLSYFTENYHWAHLDIAGTAWRSGKEKGATGRPVSLLLHYLCQQSGQSLV